MDVVPRVLAIEIDAPTMDFSGAIGVFGGSDVELVLTGRSMKSGSGDDTDSVSSAARRHRPLFNCTFSNPDPNSGTSCIANWGKLSLGKPLYQPLHVKTAEAYSTTYPHPTRLHFS